MLRLMLPASSGLFLLTCRHPGNAAQRASSNVYYGALEQRLLAAHLCLVPGAFLHTNPTRKLSISTILAHHLLLRAAST